VQCDRREVRAVVGVVELTVNQPVRGYATLPASPVVFGGAGPAGTAGGAHLSNGGFLKANVSTSNKWSVGFAFKIVDGVAQVPPPPAGSGLTQGQIEVFRINGLGGGSIWFEYFNTGAGVSGLQVNYDNPNNAFAFTSGFGSNAPPMTGSGTS
jgi:hypothetical protein